MTQTFDIQNNCLVTKDDLGNLHSFYGMPAVEYTDRNMFLWYDHGKLHRDPSEGPAFLNDILAKYFVNGKLHNDNNPAVIRTIGKKYVLEYWNDGKFIRKQSHPPSHVDMNNETIYSLFESFGSRGGSKDNFGSCFIANNEKDDHDTQNNCGLPQAILDLQELKNIIKGCIPEIIYVDSPKLLSRVANIIIKSKSSTENAVEFVKNPHNSSEIEGIFKLVKQRMC